LISAEVLRLLQVPRPQQQGAAEDEAADNSEMAVDAEDFPPGEEAREHKPEQPSPEQPSPDQPSLVSKTPQCAPRRRRRQTTRNPRSRSAISVLEASKPATPKKRFS
jgi:hypothetical protein